MIRIIFLLLVSVVTFVNPQQFLCAEDRDVEKEAGYKLGAAAVSNESKQVLALKKKLLETKAFLADKRPVDYVFVMGNALRQAAESPTGSSKPGKKLIREYAKTVFRANIGEPPSAKALEVQLRLYLETFAHDRLNVEKLSDANVESITLLLQLWNHSRNMEEFYSEFNPSNPIDDGKRKPDLHEIFSSYKGAFASNMPPGLVKDPKVRKEYETFLKSRIESQRGRVKFAEIKKPGRYFRIYAAQYLAEEFGDGTMDENLASLIRKHQPQHFEDIQRSIQDQIKILTEAGAWVPEQ